jgi:hypothetical protein
LSKDSAPGDWGPRSLQTIHKNIVEKLIIKLDDPNPNRALETFVEYFNARKEILQQSLGGNWFVQYIRISLSKLPAIGHLFKTANEKLSAQIEKKTASFFKQRINDMSNRENASEDESSKMTPK